MRVIGRARPVGISGEHWERGVYFFVYHDGCVGQYRINGDDVWPLVQWKMVAP